jgi:hypothetical protein
MATKPNRWATHVVVVALVAISVAGIWPFRPGSSQIEVAAGDDMTRPTLGSEIAADAREPAESPPPSDGEGRLQLGHQPVEVAERPGEEATAGTTPIEVPPNGLDGGGHRPDSLGLTETGAGAGGDPGGPKVIRFVYFVERDEELDPAAVANIEEQALALQEFWYEQFGGTFHLAADTVDIVRGDHEASWYDATPNGEEPRWYRLMNIRAEVRAKLGIGLDADVRIVGYPSARIDGRVGANRYADAWMDGDDITCVDGSVATTPYSADYPANCLSTVAHELGHVYGLGHEGEEDDCMQFGFYQYVNGSGLCSFAAENRQLVIDDPANEGWLEAEPGDRA